MEVEGLDLAAHHHAHDLELFIRAALGIRVQEELAEHFHVRYRDPQPPTGHEYATRFGKRRGKFVLVSKVLVHMRGVDLDGASVWKHRVIGHAAPYIDAFALLDVDDDLSFLRLPAAEMELQLLGVGEPR